MVTTVEHVVEQKERFIGKIVEHGGRVPLPVEYDPDVKIDPCPTIEKDTVVDIEIFTDCLLIYFTGGSCHTIPTSTIESIYETKLCVGIITNSSFYHIMRPWRFPLKGSC
jgi:hypothetical protein